MNPETDPLKDPRFSALIVRLREQEIPSPATDLTSRTLARWHRHIRAQRVRRIYAWRAAAAVAVLIGFCIWFMPNNLPEKSAPNVPLQILMAAQRTDGGWSADDRQPSSRYDLGVTALAVLALIHTDTADSGSPQWSAIQAGVAHLIRLQKPDGQIGADPAGAAFTRYLAAKALKAAAKLPGADPAWQEAAVRALPHSPSEMQMARLNNNLAHPSSFPPRWAEAGGPVTQAAIQLLHQ